MRLKIQSLLPNPTFDSLTANPFAQGKYQFDSHKMDAKINWNATQKDALEQKLMTMVCDGTLTVKQAQTAIKKNLVQAYQQYVGTGAIATKDQ